MSPEFSLIKQYFDGLTASRDDVVLGIGDDCALLQPPVGETLAVSIDTLIAGVHFPESTAAYFVGYKSLAVGLSDLAAMGARPAWMTLALTLPEIEAGWLREFSRGLAAMAAEYDVQLVGGDTTRGALTISIQVHGFVPAENALRRSGAQVGDMIYAGSNLGDAGAGLALVQGTPDWAAALNEDNKLAVQRALDLPTPQVALGLALRDIASAAIDVSDGLAADLTHILTASGGVGATIDVAQLPLSPALQKLPIAEARQLALTAGDDYALCFTVPPQHFATMQQAHPECRRIGIIDAAAGLWQINVAGKRVPLITQEAGYDHFAR